MHAFLSIRHGITHISCQQFILSATVLFVQSETASIELKFSDKLLQLENSSSTIYSILLSYSNIFYYDIYLTFI